MGLQLMGCRNVSVTGLNISSTGGDGIYVAGWGHHINLPNGSRLFVSTRQHSADITVRGVHCHDNYRQVTDHSSPPLLGRLQSEAAHFARSDSGVFSRSLFTPASIDGRGCRSSLWSGCG